MQTLNDVRYISFASAGTRGAMYVGVFDSLEEHCRLHGIDYETWRQDILGLAGTSAGSIAALIFALGLSRDVRHTLTRSIVNMRAILRNPDIGLLLGHFGLEDGRTFKAHIEGILTQGGLSGTSTLGDMKRLLRVDFVCVCTNLHTGAPMYLSASSHPSMCVCDAIFASCCIPFVFSPQRVDNVMVVDGCLSCALPNVFCEETTLFVRPDSNHGCDGLHNWSAFLHSLIQCASYAQYEQIRSIVARNPDRYLFIGTTTTLSSTLPFDINLTQDMLDALVHSGYVSTLNWLLRGRLFDAVATAVQAYLFQLMASPIEATEQPDDAHDFECDSCD